MVFLHRTFPELPSYPKLDLCWSLWNLLLFPCSNCHLFITCIFIYLISSLPMDYELPEDRDYAYLITLGLHTHQCVPCSQQVLNKSC